MSMGFPNVVHHIYNTFKNHVQSIKDQILDICWFLATTYEKNESHLLFYRYRQHLGGGGVGINYTLLYHSQMSTTISLP